MNTNGIELQDFFYTTILLSNMAYGYKERETLLKNPANLPTPLIRGLELYTKGEGLTSFTFLQQEISPVLQKQ